MCYILERDTIDISVELTMVHQCVIFNTSLFDALCMIRSTRHSAYVVLNNISYIFTFVFSNKKYF